VLAGGMVVAVITPEPNFVTYTVTFTISTAGTYTIEFTGKAPAGNNASLLGDISVQSSASTAPSPPPLDPSPSASPDLDPASAPSSSAPLPQLSPPPSSSEVEGQSHAASSGSQMAQNDMDALS
jgi:hypothetical protein